MATYTESSDPGSGFNIVPDLLWDLKRGNVALWLGPDWKPLDDPIAHDFFFQQDWIALWLEVSDPSIADSLRASLLEREPSGGRVITEVRDKIETTLGEVFSFAKLTPVFYLEGRGNEWNEKRKAARQEVQHGQLGAL